MDIVATWIKLESSLAQEPFIAKICQMPVEIVCAIAERIHHAEATLKNGFRPGHPRRRQSRGFDSRTRRPTWIERL